MYIAMILKYHGHVIMWSGIFVNTHRPRPFTNLNIKGGIAKWQY